MKKISILLFLTVSLLLSSCKDFLTEDPRLVETTDLVMSDFPGIKNSLYGAYAPMAGSNWYGGTYFVLEAEMRAGNAMIPINPNFTSGRLLNPFKMSYNANSTSSLWGTAYYVISAVNNVLEVLEDEEKAKTYVSTSVTQQDLDNVRAEALFIRALSHFDLLRTYSHAFSKRAGDPLGVPIILRTDKTASERPARNSIEEVYAQIEQDLTDAEKLMDDKYNQGKSNFGAVDQKAVATKEVVQALLSRVYLYQEKWQLAADYATKVINSGKYTLWTAEEYPTVWSKDIPSGGEVIFEIYGIKANSYDAYWEGPSHMTNPLGYADCAVTPQLLNLFEEGDVRGTKGVRNVDAEGVTMFATDKDEKSGGQYWTMKYQGKGFGDAKSNPDVSNTIVLRLSEMYLNRAEAIIKGASVSGVTALGDVNKIRENRGVEPLTSAGVAVVELERRKELNFEGHLWYDLARTKGTITYEDYRNLDPITPDSHFWALPIPKREFDVNPELVQNRGYDK